MTLTVRIMRRSWLKGLLTHQATRAQTGEYKPNKRRTHSTAIKHKVSLDYRSYRCFNHKDKILLKHIKAISPTCKTGLFLTDVEKPVRDKLVQTTRQGEEFA